MLDNILGNEIDFMKYLKKSCWLFLINISPSNSFLTMYLLARFYQNCLVSLVALSVYYVTT